MRCHYLLVKIHFLVHIGPIMCLNPLATAYGQMPARLITNHATSCIILGVKLNTHENCLEPKFHEDWTIGSGIKSKKPVFGLCLLCGDLDGLGGWDIGWEFILHLCNWSTLSFDHRINQKKVTRGSKIKGSYCT